MNWQRTLIILIAIAVFGLWLRMYNVNWDSGFHLHPDERFMTMTANDINWPSSLAEFWDPATSSLAPYNNGKEAYIYGTTPLFFTKYVADSLGLGDYGTINLVGRQLSAIFDTGVIIVLFLFARKVFNKHIGILAAFLYALVPFAIQGSHFFTVDPLLIFVMSLSLLLMLYFYEAKGRAAVALFVAIAVTIGIAITCKVSGVYLLPMAALTIAIKFAKNWKQKALWKNILQTLIYGLGTLLIAYLVVRLVQPYYFASASWFDITIQPDFLKAFTFEADATYGKFMYPPQWQWLGKTPYLFPGMNLLVWGMGLPIGIAAFVGLVYLVVRIILHVFRNIKPIANWHNLVKPKFFFEFFIAFWILFNFITLGGHFILMLRYFSPIIPLLCVCAALFIYNLKKINLNVAIFAGTLVIVPAMFYTFAFINIYNSDNTRVAASKWIYANVPDHAKIYNEHWDDSLPVILPNQTKSFNFNELEVYNPDDAAKLDMLYKGLSDADYLFLSSGRASDSIGRLPKDFPYMSKYYKYLDNGSLGFSLVEKNTSFPNLFGITFNDESAMEALWVYDHPTVRIYKKQVQITRVQFDKLFK